MREGNRCSGKKIRDQRESASGDIMVSRIDYNAAKEYLIHTTLEYAKKIVPSEVTLEVLVSNLKTYPGLSHYGYMAVALGNEDWSKSKVVYDSALVKSNVYNIQSRFFNELSKHELCHIKHGFEEPDSPERLTHRRPKYKDCIKASGGMDGIKVHPSRYSYRAYLGSESKVVPCIINNMVFYVCRSCDHAALWNTCSLGNPRTCDSCNSSNIEWTRLSPFDTYRVAVMNEIDCVEKSAPAHYFVYDRDEF